jgi:hypothetical protein
MCTILAGYRSFITAPIAALAAPPGTPSAPVTTAPGSGASGELIANFDVAGFVSSQKSPRLRVLRQRLCSCQSWQSFIEGACSSGRKSLALVFFDACLEAVHTWPGKDEDGPDNHSMIDIGTYGAAAVASKSETCLCGRRNRRRPSDLSPQCPFCKLVLVPTRQLNSSVPIRIDFGGKLSSRPASPANPKADAVFDHGVVMTMNSFLNAKDGLPPSASAASVSGQPSATQSQQQSATVDDVLFRNRDKRSWPKWDPTRKHVESRYIDVDKRGYAAFQLGMLPRRIVACRTAEETVHQSMGCPGAWCEAHQGMCVWVKACWLRPAFLCCMSWIWHSAAVGVAWPPIFQSKFGELRIVGVPFCICSFCPARALHSIKLLTLPPTMPPRVG